jgi:hypothetical protein
MPRAKKTPPNKITPKSLFSKKKRVECLKNLFEAKIILTRLASLKITRHEEFRLLQNLSIYLLNTHSRITTPSIPIERFLNQLKIHLLIAQMNFSNIGTCVQAINVMEFNIETFDGMSHSAFELLQHCSTIESLITQIESSFGMIRMILEQIPEESRQRLVASIQAFRDTFDQFVNEFASKNEEIMKFLNSAKEHIELMIRNSETASRLELYIQEVAKSRSTASSNQTLMDRFLNGRRNKLTINQTQTALLTDSMKRLIEEYVRTQHERQIECPSLDIDSILRAMSSISPQFELYRQSDDSPTARTYEQNLFDSRMKKGLDMIHAMIANHNTQGLRKVCAYLVVLLKHCYVLLKRCYDQSP